MNGLAFDVPGSRWCVDKMLSIREKPLRVCERASRFWNLLHEKILITCSACLPSF
ncbi:hypothetical protein J2W83_004065 [Pseudomonas hunanensis]|uniref:Uncharacterized protein n=1 Tax=Pseudomonas hunanensis TaxID=1247546 RepID=A0ACC6K7H2_9PSED|nr:hypothetical protein [Pseudomonas hunanensis]